MLVLVLVVEDADGDAPGGRRVAQRRRHVVEGQRRGGHLVLLLLLLQLPPFRLVAPVLEPDLDLKTVR